MKKILLFIFLAFGILVASEYRALEDKSIVYKDENGNDLRGKAVIIIAKHRNGAVGDVLLTFKGQYARFENPDEETATPLPGEDFNDISRSELSPTGEDYNSINRDNPFESSTTELPPSSNGSFVPF